MNHKHGKLIYSVVAAIYLMVSTTHCIAQSNYNEGIATSYAKKFTDDDVLITTSYQYFTFDKGKNALGDKVVEIEEQSEYEYTSLKKFSSATHPEFYNKFIQLKNFKRAINYLGTKFVTLDKGGYDRSVTGDDIFFDDSRVQYYGMRFNGVGSTQRITVKKVFGDGKYLTKIFFNNVYPIKERTVEFKVPEWLNVAFIPMNFDKGVKVDLKKTTKGGYTYYVFTANDLPAYKNEYRRIGRSSTDAHIIVQLKSFEYKGETIKGFDKVDDVYAWNNRLYLMAGNDVDKIKPTVNKLIADKKTDVDKIKAIYYWVQDNIRYIAYEDGYSGYIPASVQDVVSKKYGDCKGMANLLTEMLTIAGYKAYLTWIGTRSIPYSQSLPALCVNNHCICTLEYAGNVYYLDGTESYGPLGQNAFRIQGKEVMIAKGAKFEIQTVPLTTAADNKLLTKADFTLNNDVLKGIVKVTITGNQRTDFHQNYQELASNNQESFLNNFLEFGNNNLVATNVKTSDLKNRDLPISIEGNIDLSNTVNNISGDKYIGIDFFPKSLDRLIPNEKRIQGYDIDDVLQFEDEISLTIPADRKYIDKPDNLEIKKDGYEFKGTYTIVGNKITLTKILSIKNSIIPKSEFAQWESFIKSIKAFNTYLLSVTKK